MLINMKILSHPMNRVQRVMVACVVDEVEVVIKPALEYKIDKVHLIHFIQNVDSTDINRTARSRFYQQFFDEVCKRLEDENIIWEEHNKYEVWKFDKMLEEVYHIVDEETKSGSIVYVNISGGTNQYAAAAAIASMTLGATLFNMGSDVEYSAEHYEKWTKECTVDDKLLGRTIKVTGPYELDKIDIKPPDIKLLKALKIFSMVPLKERINRNVIYNLMRNGLWFPSSLEDNQLEGSSFNNENDFNLRNKEGVQYERQYVKKWLSWGWISNEDTNGTIYDLTKMGKMYIDVYCSDYVFTPTQNYDPSPYYGKRQRRH